LRFTAEGLVFLGSSRKGKKENEQEEKKEKKLGGRYWVQGFRVYGLGFGV